MFAVLYIYFVYIMYDSITTLPDWFFMLLTLCVLVVCVILCFLFVILYVFSFCISVSD